MAVLEAVGAGLPVVHAQVPAFDVLAEPVRGAVRVDPAAEAASIRSGVDAALSTAGGERLPVPPALVEAYGIAGVAARLDALIDRVLELAVARVPA